MLIHNVIARYGTKGNAQVNMALSNATKMNVSTLKLWYILVLIYFLKMFIRLFLIFAGFHRTLKFL